MAWDAFMKLADIKGESKRKDHEGEIEVIALDFGGTNPSSVGVGGGGGTGVVTLSNFTITKKTDAASVDIFLKMCKGQHFEEATLSFYKAAGDSALKYLEFKYKKVFVETINWSGSEGGDDVATETVSFAFGTVEMTYTEQTDRGTAGGDHAGGWDVMTRQEI